MRLLFVYEGSPNDFLKHCTFDLEKQKWMFEGKELETLQIIGKKMDIKDWIRDYIETHHTS